MSELAELRDAVARLGARNSALEASLDGVAKDRDRYAQRCQELEPAADCWNALAKCYRMTFMGSAGCNPADGKVSAGYAHIAMNFWTALPDSPDAKRDQGQQDLLGRSQFGKFMDIALANAKVQP